MVAISAQKSRFVPLPVPASLGAITVADVNADASRERHREAVRRWAGSVWEAWTPSHGVVQCWLDGIFPDAERIEFHRQQHVLG
jgi:Family of unknown function (DUF5946)